MIKIKKFLTKGNLIKTSGLILTSLGGFIYYEYKQINKYLINILDTRILDKDTKRPDYIYIQYHIYHESMQKLKRKEVRNAKWIHVYVINPIGKWWKTFKHSIAWRILNIAQNGDKAERFKAVNHLSRFNHLKDWDFRHLAQILDARTAASLAHSDADPRWFIPLHKSGIVKNPKIVLAELNQMFLNLLPHPCVDHFMKRFLLRKPPDINSIRPKYIKKKDLKMVAENYMLREYCTFLFHITKHEELSKKIVQKGHLATLLELTKMFENDVEALVHLAKCISHISVIPDVVEHFFVTGWIRKLVEWRHHRDIRLKVISAKSLGNLDLDDVHHKLCTPNIYQLYPMSRFLREPKCEVIFVHGLLGGVFITWRQKKKTNSELGFYESIVPLEEAILPVRPKREVVEYKDENQILVDDLEQPYILDDDWEVVFPDCPEEANTTSISTPLSVPGTEWFYEDITNQYTHCWPMEWLPEDFSDIRVLGVDYPSIATEWSSDYTKCYPCELGNCDLEGRSQLFLEMLSRCSIGADERPIIWIGHSLGGILIKKMLVKAEACKCKIETNRIARNTNAIIFLGTPHNGSSLAKWKSTVKSVIAPSIEVVELEENNQMLVDLHRKFMHFLREKYPNINVISFAEDQPTMLTTLKLPLTIVTKSSSNINYGEYYVLKYDHLSVCKPFYRQSFLYQRIVQAIQEVLEGKYKKI